ncbi:LPS translocon maturation chaperone LptM [Diaphorobacter ruginosibacter]|uniref:LPS translocon maturation chaperone LptM n=1 Tax=Diaphorobacter ruginosibacter TaxID=1715720 RepID=UPI001CB74092|nr:lipoprotein [Diaphorobacter ruginosibacter]
MLKSCQILFRTIALGGIAVVTVACGQRGPLYLPTEPAAAQRATLPETLNPARKPSREAAPASTAEPSPASRSQP